MAKNYEKNVFWKEGYDGAAKGGIFFRSYNLNKFLTLLELEKNEEIVGIRFDENNIEILVKSDIVLQEDKK